jgi:hypothetical protein
VKDGKVKFWLKFFSKNHNTELSQHHIQNSINTPSKKQPVIMVVDQVSIKNDEEGLVSKIDQVVMKLDTSYNNFLIFFSFNFFQGE